MAQVTDMLADHAVADPYSYFAGLREAAPLHRDEHLGAWLVLRYDDVRAAFRDSRLSSDRISPYFERRRALGDTGGERTTFEVLTRWIVFTDPPRHTRLRKLVEYAFRPRAVERMRGWIASLVEELVEDLGSERELEFIERFASPLPVRVICDLFGVPHESRSDLTRWSGDILTLVFGAMHSADRHERAERGLREFSEFLRDVIAERRVRPGEDLVSDLVAAEERGDVLEEEEIVATCVLLLFAGHETTRNLLANGLKAILEHAAARAALAADPSVMTDAVEEILRFDGPIKGDVAPGHRARRVRRASDRARRARSARAGVGEPRSAEVRRPGDVRHRAPVEPARGVRLLHPLLPRRVHRAPGGCAGPRRLPGAVPERIARRGHLRVGPARPEPIAQAAANSAWVNVGAGGIRRQHSVEAHGFPPSRE